MAQPAVAPSPEDLVRRPDYLRLIALAGVLGVPVSLAAFGFLAAIHQLEHWAWETLPHALTGGNPWWWPVPLLLVAGLAVGAVVRFLPGHGGHVPADGMGAGVCPPVELPGVLLAAFASLPLGAVLGPEAPLMALGSGLAAWVAGGLGMGQRRATVIGVSGAAAAIATVFGSPVVAAILLMEMVQLSGLALSLVILPCLMAAGIGAVVFTGLGAWTGLPIAHLSLPLPPGAIRPDPADLLWSVPIALVAALGVRWVHGLARAVAPAVAARPLTRTPLAALAVAACACAYALLTGRDPAEVASSGQQTLAAVAAAPQSWTTAALVLLLLTKGLGYALSLASLRGGPVFPAICLGGVLGVLAAPLPGLGLVGGLAAGMAAATVAALPAPVSATVLVLLLLGGYAVGMAPVVLVAVVVAFVAEHIFTNGLNRDPLPDSR
ncbi:chloride channel protein [Catellatospora tritici]|uniref:chloride channel protein n=1 Tax=Catellatospora tritici TaxID=2851566 RepID=UPI001C2CF25E|nr:chloride channel protein [Catellatospora tritici]MBV1850888.1 chloride channel protein [Catellatospora tritici]MBV1851141.1 chloride channel protein [Catellatospora tritici]